MSAQPATNEAPNIFEKLQEVEGPIAQLEFAMKRVGNDGLSVKYIENCIEGLRSWTQELVAIANADYNEHDELIDRLERRDLAARMFESELAKAQEALEIAEGRLSNQNEEVAEALDKLRDELSLHMLELNAMVDQQKSALEEKTNLLEVYKQRDINQRATIKELSILEPKKLKKKNDELKMEARAARKTITELSQEIHRRDKNLIELRKDNSILMRGLESERGEVARLESHIERANNISSGYRNEQVLPNGQPLHFVINRQFRGTYIAKDPSELPRYVNNMDFTYIIWASIGVGAAVSVNEWLRPTYRRDPLISEYWPEDLYYALEDMIYDELSNTHPHLLKRVDWAKSIALDDIEGISPTVKKALAADHHQNLRDIVMFDADELAMTKGMGKKSAEQTLAICYALVAEWDRENGAPELAYGKEPN